MTDIKRDEIIPPWLATIQEAVERHLKKPDGFFDMDLVLADIKTVFAPFLASMDLPGLADEVAARHTRPDGTYDACLSGLRIHPPGVVFVSE